MPYCIQVETRAGTPIQATGMRLVPFTRVVRLLVPGRSGGLVWNRPVAVLAISSQGEEIVLPVHDQTRRLQFAILGASLLVGCLLWLARPR